MQGFRGRFHVLLPCGDQAVSARASLSRRASDCNSGRARESLCAGAVAALSAYAWPGNVRELKNLVESVLVSVPGDEIRVEDLPPALREATDPDVAAGLSPGARLADVERELIRVTLEHNGGNRTHSAAMLELQRSVTVFLSWAGNNWRVTVSRRSNVSLTTS